MRIARPAATWASMRLCSPCATSEAISTPSFIGPGCRDDGVRRSGGDALGGELVAARVLGGRGEQRTAHPLTLDAQGHHGVGADDRAVEVRIALDVGQRQRVLALGCAANQRRGEQRARRDQRHVGAESGQRPDVGADDARMQHVADDHDAAAVERPEGVLQDVGVEQRLGGVRVLAVAGVDHVRVDRLRDQIGRAGGGMAHDHHIAPTAAIVLTVSTSDSPFSTLERSAADVDHIGAEHLAGQLERGAGAGAGFVEEVADGHAAQRGGAGDGAIEHLAHRTGGLEHMLDLAAFEQIDIEQVAVPPGRDVDSDRRRRFEHGRDGSAFGDHGQLRSVGDRLRGAG